MILCCFAMSIFNMLLVFHLIRCDYGAVFLIRFSSRYMILKYFPR